jgi:DNA (cytosine-5)-methyltransferase 1
MIRYGSVCSGIEAVTVAWHDLGFIPAFFSEIEPAARAVLAHRWPGVPLHGDFTTIGGDEYGAIDLLVGGTPCQSFSVAGLRGGLADDRGNLALAYLRLAQRKRPKWLVWENVPGVLSSDGGRDFGAILGGMVELGYGVAYRVLDAQHFGVPQRRRRVFAVGYLGDWRRAAAVLFERHSLQGHSPPRRQPGQRAAVPIAAGSDRGSGYRLDADTADNLIVQDIANCLTRRMHKGINTTMDEGQTLIATSLTASRSSTQCPNEDTTLVATGRCGEVAATLQAGVGGNGNAGNGSEAIVAVAHSLRAEGFDASEDGTGRGTPLVPVAYRVHAEYSTAMVGNGAANVADPVEVARTIDSCGGYATNQGGNVVLQPVSFTGGASDIITREDIAQPVTGRNGDPGMIAFNLRGREGGAQPEADPDNLAAMRAASGGSSRSYLAFDTTQITSAENYSNPRPGDPCHPLAAGAHPPAVAFAQNSRDEVRLHGGDGQTDGALAAEPGMKQTCYVAFDVLGLPASEVARETDVHTPLRARVPGQLENSTVTMVMPSTAVRRLTPRECERLQGFPDDYTLVPYRGGMMADGPRYKCLGNSMAVPVVRWIGQRILMVEALGAAEQEQAA